MQGVRVQYVSKFDDFRVKCTFLESVPDQSFQVLFSFWGGYTRKDFALVNNCSFDFLFFFLWFSLGFRLFFIVFGSSFLFSLHVLNFLLFLFWLICRVLGLLLWLEFLGSRFCLFSCFKCSGSFSLLLFFFWGDTGLKCLFTSGLLSLLLFLSGLLLSFGFCLHLRVYF